MQRNVKKQACKVESEYDPRKKGLVIEKHIKAEMRKCLSWQASVSQKKNEEAVMIKCFKLVLYQSWEKKNEVKGFFIDSISQSGCIYLSPSSLSPHATMLVI